MRRQGQLTMRHLIVAVLAVIVVNAQLSWWIVFTIRETRVRLHLERRLMTAASRLAAEHIRAELAGAADALASALAGAPGLAAPLPPPFVRIEPLSGKQAPPGWTASGRNLQLIVAAGQTRVRAIPAAAWIHRLMTPPEGLEIVSVSDAARIPGVTLPPPLTSFQVRPTPQRWAQALSMSRSHILMVVSEGSFFALLIFVMMGLLWISLRRELELERQHQNFLSAITHELKSPLASVRLSLETLLRRRADEATAKRFLEHALEDTERLGNLVEKVLEVTRYATGRRAITLDIDSLSFIVEETVAAFTRRAAATQVDIRTEIEPGIFARVDREAFSIALSNLLENALKYGGDPPVIRVGLHARERQTTLTVEDNGHGIPEADIPLIFDQFFRSGDEMTRTASGTGLGLFLVKAIITAHHGTVGVASTGPHGTVFQITLERTNVEESTE
ncbi:MAG: HAMP domain-containing histidine kinase [Acidobacteria bacterium]|nr:HAMP domain-containing histidine kinase [Acidobacteriota bacterium]